MVLTVCNTQTTVKPEHKTALKELPFSNPLSGRRLNGGKKKPTENDAGSVAQRGNNSLQYKNNEGIYKCLSTYYLILFIHKYIKH